MKLISENRTLSIALGVSILVHGALLAVRFAAPDAFRFKPEDPGLEVILVNAKHDRAPLKAEALAQANLDGGGNADKGRAKSPLPDMHRNDEGNAMKAVQRRIEELEAQQRMLAQLNNNKHPSVASSAKELLRPNQKRPQPNGTDAIDSTLALQQRIAEINKRIEEENKRPKKTFISPSTREVGYALYYANFRQQIEKIGTLNFPQKDGRKLYGELTMSISIFHDGTIYVRDREGGVSIERSSGNPDLDEAARRIVYRSAPFGAFAKDMRSSGKDDVWVVTTRFKFTRDDAMEAVMYGDRN